MKEKKAIKETFKELSPRYEEAMDSELKLFWGWSYNKFLEELISRTDIKVDQTILDIATGTSYIPRRILDQKIPGVKIIAQDISLSMLRQGRKKIEAENKSGSITMACSDAMALPFMEHSFDLVVTGLSSHHMNIPTMLSEMKRVLKPGGQLSLIDVGTSPLWELPIMKFVARFIAFFFFLIRENPSRAWAEAAAVKNLRTAEGWQIDLHKAGFITINIHKLSSKYRWTPEPLSIQSYKSEAIR